MLGFASLDHLDLVFCLQAHSVVRRMYVNKQKKDI